MASFEPSRETQRPQRGIGAEVPVMPAHSEGSEPPNRLQDAESRQASAWWIENDGLLRDEGAVFGLSALERLPESKVEAVEAYYRARVARTEASRRPLLEERDVLQRRAEELLQRVEFLGTAPVNDATDRADSARVDDPASPSTHGGLLRYLVGSALALALCVFAYFVTREVLGDGFDQPELVAIGVMFAGMFVVFAPVSLLFSSDQRHLGTPWATELWKVRLAEVGFPIIAALFAVAWGERRDPAREVVAFLFLGMLFLLGGRLLLSLATRLGTEFEVHRHRWRRWRREKATKKEMVRVRAEFDASQRRIEAILGRLRELRAADELKAECEHKVAMLRSEFELARAARAAGGSLEMAPLHAGSAGDR